MDITLQASQFTWRSLGICPSSDFCKETSLHEPFPQFCKLERSEIRPVTVWIALRDEQKGATMDLR